MLQAARHIEPLETRLTTGFVRASSGAALAVAAEDGDLVAQRAVGCLLAPRPGDRVLVALAGREAFVLSVLSRPEGRLDAELDFPGSVALRAGGDINLLAENDLRAVAGLTLHLSAETAEARFGQASILATGLRATAKALSVVAVKIEQVAEGLTQRLKNAVRLVEEHEEVQAGSSRYLVEKTLTMHSRNAVHVAEEVVKIDGAQVHLG